MDLEEFFGDDVASITLHRTVDGGWYWSEAKKSKITFRW